MDVGSTAAASSLLIAEATPTTASSARPLSDGEIIVDAPGGQRLAFDVERAAHHVITATQHSEYWKADVRWFTLSTIPIALAAAALCIVAISYDSDTWVVLTLQLCVVLMLLCTWLLVRIALLFWHRVAFYFVLCSMMCTILALILWLSIYARDLLHTHAWLWWTLSAVLILEVLVFISIFMALASLVSCGLVLQQYEHIGADLRLIDAAGRFEKNRVAAAATKENDVKKTN